MTTNYPVADMLTRIRNGLGVNKSSVHVIKSKICIQILEVLEQEGVIKNSCLDPDNLYQIQVFLTYHEGQPVMQKLRTVSKPGHRVYTSVRNLWRLNRGLGFFILSTPKGILSDRQACENNVGGEDLCKIT